MRGELSNEVSLGADVVVTGIVRPADYGPADPLASVNASLIDATDIRQPDATTFDLTDDRRPNAGHDQGEYISLSENKSRPSFGALLGSVAPSIAGWNRGKLVILLQYVLGQTGDSELLTGWNVLLVPHANTDPAPLSRSFRRMLSDTVYTHIDDCKKPIVPKVVKKEDDRYWLEAGQVACAKNRMLVIDSVNTLADVDQRWLGIALNGDTITVHKAGFAVEIASPDGVIAATTPRVFEETPGRVLGGRLAAPLQDAFDLVVPASSSEEPSVGQLTDAIDSGRFVPQSQRRDSTNTFDQHSSPERCRSYLQYIQSQRTPPLSSDAKAAINDHDEELKTRMAMPANDDRDTDTITTIAAAIAKLRCGDAITAADVTRARRLVGLLF
jgi:DNA replicative helicase MCM subunit Mcm2 (Cdc46/Mcm family)